MKQISRRDFLKITAVAGSLIAGGTLLKRELYPPFILKETRWLMGAAVHLTVVSHDEKQAQEAMHDTFAEMNRQILLFDHRDANSPLYKLNQSGSLLNPPSEIVSIFERALQISELSEGAFDITVKPLVDARASHFDVDASVLSLVDYRSVTVDKREIRFHRPGMQATLDGIGQGTVVDAAVAVLNAAGFGDVLVEAAGELLVSGRPASGDGWQIGIAHPRPEVVSGNLVSFTLQHGAAGTSGDYYKSLSPDRKEHHIVDPRLGASPGELASVTVLAPDATTADALATALMVLGSDAGLRLANSLDGVEALVVAKDLTVRRTIGFPHYSPASTERD